MNKYGQAEYAAEILKQISEKMLSAGIITDEQKKRLDSLILKIAIVVSAQYWRLEFVRFDDTIQ